MDEFFKEIDQELSRRATDGAEQKRQVEEHTRRLSRAIPQLLPLLEAYKERLEKRGIAVTLSYVESPGFDQGANLIFELKGEKDHSAVGESFAIVHGGSHRTTTEGASSHQSSFEVPFFGDHVDLKSFEES